MYRIGIDLGGTNVAVGIVDNDNKIVIKGSVPTDAKRHPDYIIKDMASLCEKLLKEANILLCQIEMIGIASPGAVDSANGVITYAGNINMIDYPIVEKLKSHLDVKRVYVENDANAAAMGEAVAGSGKGVNSFVMITLGTGVGGGIVINGKIYSGFNGAGGEIGHMVIEHNGLQCTCGRRGCWETYSSATGLITMTKESMVVNRRSLMWKLVDGNIENVSGKTAFQAAAKGDKSAREVCAQYTDYLACGLVNIINIFQPEMISIGGGVSKEGANLLDPLVELVERDQFTRRNSKKTEIRVAELGNDAGIIGASLLG